MKLKLLSKGTSQDDRAYIRSSEYILFEILKIKTTDSTSRLA